ncbi:MAG: PIN domain-containing protein [Rhodobacteraceae bacterium]|nr:PIN domain-containing protein [Paracoccaceae bacterium]
MRVLLDACVLYPTVMRDILTGVAARGLFTPLWSARILEEWARAVARNLPDQAEIARAEIALLRADWPDAEVAVTASDEAGLFLPDENDLHVLAAAIAGRAQVLLTLNLGDFPTRVLAAQGILRRDPDGFLFGLWQDRPDIVAGVCETVRRRAEAASGQPQPMRKLLKRAGLPRLGKALG